MENAGLRIGPRQGDVSQSDRVTGNPLGQVTGKALTGGKKSWISQVIPPAPPFYDIT